MNPGVLMVMMEPPPELEPLYDAWYELELIPDHLRVPGITMGSRWMCLGGWPRQMAMYDLESLAVLHSQAYRSMTADRFSPWSKWMLARVMGRERMVWEQRSPTPHGTGERSRGLVLMRLRGRCGSTVEAALDRLEMPPECSSRILVSAESSSLTWGAPPAETAVIIDAPALALIPSWEGVPLARALGGLAGKLIGVWRYARYIPAQRPPSAPMEE